MSVSPLALPIPLSNHALRFVLLYARFDRDALANALKSPRFATALISMTTVCALVHRRSNRKNIFEGIKERSEDTYETIGMKLAGVSTFPFFFFSFFSFSFFFLTRKLLKSSGICRNVERYWKQGECCAVYLPLTNVTCASRDRTCQNRYDTG